MSRQEPLPTQSAASQADPPSAGASCAVCGARLSEARCGACGAATRAGGYMVRRLIARTPHSRVYLARGADGREVALKELLFAQVPSTQELEAFEREARLLQALSHPRIPRLLGSFQEGQGAELRLYLVAEYRTIFLVDFGAARESVKGATTGSTLVGTFGYMPLEQFGGTVDVTSDLYALGATLMHLLGRTPPAEHFQPDRGLDLSHLDAPDMKPWLQRLTALRAADRYRSATLARKALVTLRPGGHRAQPTQVPAGVPPPEASAALARLAREASAAREASHKSEGRWAQRERERVEREQREDRLEGDRLTLMDFYLMACLPVSSPRVLPWMGIVIALGVYIVSARLGLFEVPSLLTLAGVQLVLGLISLVYAALGGPPLIKALRLRRAFRQLPFALEGLGQVVHRAEGNWRRFTRCSLRIVFREQELSSASVELVKTARSTALQLAVERVNATLSRVARYPEFFQKLRWTFQEDQAEGYANWRIAGLLLTFCVESLVPLQREQGLLKAVLLEPSSTQFTLPEKRS